MFQGRFTQIRALFMVCAALFFSCEQTQCITSPVTIYMCYICNVLTCTLTSPSHFSNFIPHPLKSMLHVRPCSAPISVGGRYTYAYLIFIACVLLLTFSNKCLITRTCIVFIRSCFKFTPYSYFKRFSYLTFKFDS